MSLEPVQTVFKCPWCPCIFVSAGDLFLHRSVCKGRMGKLGWCPSSFDDSEICPSERDPELARAYLQNGKVVMGGFEVSLSGNGRWLKRRRVGLNV